MRCTLKEKGHLTVHTSDSPGKAIPSLLAKIPSVCSLCFQRLRDKLVIHHFAPRYVL